MLTLLVLIDCHPQNILFSQTTAFEVCSNGGREVTQVSRSNKNACETEPNDRKMSCLRDSSGKLVQDDWTTEQKRIWGCDHCDFC